MTFIKNIKKIGHSPDRKQKIVMSRLRCLRSSILNYCSEGKVLEVNSLPITVRGMFCPPAWRQAGGFVFAELAEPWCAPVKWNVVGGAVFAHRGAAEISLLVIRLSRRYHKFARYYKTIFLNIVL